MSDDKTELEFFTEEYDKMQKSRITCNERKTVNDRDLIEDIHLMLAGNGGPSHGLVYKTAESLATQKVMKQHINSIRTDLSNQITYCKTVQDLKRIEKAKKQGIAYVTGKIWDQRNIMAFILICAFLYLLNSNTLSKSEIKAEVEKSVVSTIGKQFGSGITR